MHALPLKPTPRACHNRAFRIEDAPHLVSSEDLCCAIPETLKYLYLLFSPRSHLPPDEFVLNTEAHPLRISDPSQPPVMPRATVGPNAKWSGPLMPAEGGLGVI